MSVIMYTLGGRNGMRGSGRGWCVMMPRSCVQDGKLAIV